MAANAVTAGGSASALPATYADAASADVRLEKLTKRFDEVVAVDAIDLAIPRGSFFALLGPSGCGKTTTLRAIAGLERPVSGEILIGGTPVFSSSPKVNVPAERRELSMVFQSYAIWPHMTVFDNVAYGLRVRKRPDAEVTARVQEALDLVLGQTDLAGGLPVASLSCTVGLEIYLWHDVIRRANASLGPHQQTCCQDLIISVKYKLAVLHKLLQQVQIEIGKLHSNYIWQVADVDQLL